MKNKIKEKNNIKNIKKLTYIKKIISKHFQNIFERI